MKNLMKMKGNLTIGVSAVVMLALASCMGEGENLYQTPISQTNGQTQVEQTYSESFVKVFGEPAANQNWGFGATPANARRVTRTITVNGDAYDKFPSADDVASYFPTEIPADADEVSQLESLYKGQSVQTQWGETQMWDLYAIYANKIVEGYNLKVTQAGTVELGGNYQNASWDGTAGRNLAHPYNVYVDVDGDLTVRRVGATHFNLYILRGNVTLESNYGEQAGLISVAEGATLNDQRNSIAANQGVKIFNKGVINATNVEKYDIGNFCTVYNMGKFNVTGALTYSPGDANDSYFMNLGDDAELTARSMTLNSTGNFFNDGKVNITGATTVTQARLYWVNAGHYTTGSMVFSAKNTTFYNYCQLIVRGNAKMYDGEFNLMQNSYTEAGTANFDNFIVNMDSNTGMYVKGNVRMEAQGDGTYQGFRTSGDNCYLLVDGKVQVACHRETFSVSSGITYSINEIEIDRDGTVVTDEYLQSIGDGCYPVLNLSAGIECPYGELSVTPNTNSCGAVWHKVGEQVAPNDVANDAKPSLHVMAEDLSATEASDFDFNDVVIDVQYVDPSTVDITLVAAGGTLPLRICKNNDWEVHKLFGVEEKCMVNTGTKFHVAKAPYSQATREPVTLRYTEKTWSTDQSTFEVQVRDQIVLEVQKEGKWYELKAEQGKPACKVATPVNIYMSPDWYEDEYRWANEKQNIGNGFAEWVVNPAVKWYTTK